MGRTGQDIDGTRSGWWGVVVSLAFWLSLLAAAGCLAAVALAPKLLQGQILAEQYAENQRRLVLLERETLQLAQVVQALERDPTFAEELARVEFDAYRPGEELIPVEPALRLDRRVVPPPVARQRTWAANSLMLRLATDQRLRNRLLLTAAGLVVAAFTWCQETAPKMTADAPRRSRRSIWQWLRERYSVPHPPVGH
jgi:cell division protein FtsB